MKVMFVIKMLICLEKIVVMNPLMVWIRIYFFFFFRKVIEFPIGIQNTGRYLNKWKYILLKVNYNN